MKAYMKKNPDVILYYNSIKLGVDVDKKIKNVTLLLESAVGSHLQYSFH